ncbi:unnamed protein product [Musa acuminata subsp. malaccensis]|uniref:(wild Malaysian banana) hypothetical protein n=1 Tax=Musa acuminata subsp. malaccensis TaxID=214687 RepID=A0A804KKY8_MUSAM|nr:unnamed protein product [Musa acuminata subsp. malaccensis]
MIIENDLPNESVYPLLHRELMWWLDVETYLVVNSNKADKITYLSVILNKGVLT